MSKLQILSDGRILIKHVRLSYPHLFKPWAKNASDNAKFSGRFLMDKKEHAAEIKELAKHILQLQTEHFKGRIPAAQLFMRNGEGTAKEEQEESWIIAASEKPENPPTIMNRDKSELTEADNARHNIMFAGCYVNVLIKPWAQNNNHGKRLNANLLAVQFCEKGKPFGSERPPVDDAFGDISDEFEDEQEGVGGDDPFADDDDTPF